MGYDCLYIVFFLYFCTCKFCPGVCIFWCKTLWFNCTVIYFVFVMNNILMRKYYYIAGFLLLTLDMSGSFVRAEESRLPERRGMGDVLSDTLVWTVCDSAYSWRGHTYSATGVYTDTVFEALPGVDSVYVLSLTVNYSTPRITTASA